MSYLYFKKPSKKFYPTVKIVKKITGKKILAFAPHSDDLGIGAGGFLAQLAKTNIVKPVLGYSGFRGVAGELSPRKAIRLREEEMKKEAKILKIRSPIFLQLTTYEKNTPQLRKADKEKIKTVIRKEKPVIIFLSNQYDLHPRHKLLSRLILDVLKGLKWKGELFFYEIPWSVFSGNEFDFIVPLSSKLMKQKINAIKVHKSQLKRTDFVRLSKALLALRAGMVPEQKITGYGADKISLGEWVEVYKYTKLES